jgi:threonine synthase
MVNQGSVEFGKEINIVVTAGNFGNILAAYFAKEMGLPVNKLICASNKNKVLTDFITTGTYDRNREFFTTDSPSMDILISSNLERLLYLLCGRNSDTINEWFSSLNKDGKYTVSEDVKAKVQELFAAGTCDDCGTKKAIKETYEKYNYLSDTHTAVAISVCDDYIKTTGDKTPVVIASTASPFKFSKAVLSAVDESGKEYADEFSTVNALETLTSNKAPSQLAELKEKKVRFNLTADKNDMAKVVFDMLGI